MTPSSGEKTAGSAPRENGSRAREIIEAATGLFARHGFEGVSVRDICAELSLNFSIISYYFQGKRGLYREVLRTQLEAYDQVFQKTAAQGLSPREELEALTRALAEWRERHPHFSALLARECGTPGPEMAELAPKYENSLGGGRLAEIVRAGQRRGQFKTAVSSEAAALMLNLAFNAPGLSPVFGPPPGPRHFDSIREFFQSALEPGSAEKEPVRAIGKQTAKPRWASTD